MAKIETWFTCDLHGPVQVHTLDNDLFNQDSLGNVIGVRVYSQGEPVTLSGSVNGYIVRSDGVTVPVAGTRSGNRAYITMPSSAYAVVGVVQIVIKLTEGSSITTLAACVGYMHESRTGSQVDPGSTVTDWTNQIAAELQAVEDATNNMAMLIAVPYESLTYPVPFGAYTINNGTLYKCVVPIPSSESFTAAHWEQKKICEEIEDLEKRLRNMFIFNDTITMSFEKGNINSNNGGQTTSSQNKRSRTRYYYYVPFGFSFTVPDGYRVIIYYYNAELVASYIGYVSNWYTGTIVVEKPKGIYIRVVISKTDDSDFDPSDITTPIQLICNQNTDLTLTKEHRAADSKTTGFKISDIENAFNDTTGTTILHFINGRYKTSALPETGMLVFYENDADYVCTISECTEGDIFTADVYGYTGTIRAWYFLTSEMKIVNSSSYATANTHLQGSITAPANAAYVVFNNMLSRLPSGYSACKGQAITSLLDKKIGYIKQLNSSDDLHTILTPGWYRWITSSPPTNRPTNWASIMLVLGSSGTYSQIVINSKGVIYSNVYDSPNWTDWFRIADNADIQRITETITDVTSIASITGDPEDTYYITGLTLTKKSNSQFTLTGKSNKTAPKGFSVLLGANQVTGSQNDTMIANITEPGIYTLGYKASIADAEPLFAITDSTLKNRKYIYSGESFEVDDPVCLFVYGKTTLNLTGKTLTVDWALYKGEEYMGFPYLENNQLIAVDPIARNLSLRKSEEEKQNEIVSWGKSNTMANAKQIMEVVWSPKAATMPRGTETYYDMDTTYKGMPYSSVRDNDKAVGTNVSLHTFMTAINDPNSVLYTRRSTTGNANAYYGTVCSGLCNHAYALGLHLTNYFLGNCDWFETIPMQSIQRGDMLYISGHVAMIYDVGKDEWGRIENVTVMEEWAPNSRVKYYSSYESFLSGRSGYIARRYKYLDGVTYEQIPYVRCFDEDVVDPVYPDVQPDHGDEAVFGYYSGAESNFTDYANVSGVKVNVINTRDFSSIIVTREGASSPVYSTSTIASFTIPGSSIVPGLYTITAIGTEYTSVSTFFVADVSGSYDKDSGIITFESSNATPVLVDVYDLNEFDLGELSNGYVSSTNGSFTSSESYKRTGYVSFPNHSDTIKISVVITSNMANTGLALYNSSKVYISGVNFASYNIGDFVYVDIPVEAKYFVYCASNGQASNMRAFLLDSGRYRVVCQPIPLDDSDRAAGQINLNTHEVVVTHSGWREYKYAKVTFNTPYGQALWRSEAHPTWLPII